MKYLILTAFLFLSSWGECVVFLSENVKSAKLFAGEFKKYDLTTYYIKSIGTKYNLSNDKDLTQLVKKSHCAYAMIDPVTLSSTNINREANFKGSIRLYKKGNKKFETVVWEKKKKSNIINLYDKNAKEQVIKRFAKLSVNAAMEYYKAPLKPSNKR